MEEFDPSGIKLVEKDGREFKDISNPDFSSKEIPENDDNDSNDNNNDVNSSVE